MKYLILGGSGLLGREIQALLKSEGVDYDAPPHEEVDICDRPTLRAFLERGYDWIIHMAAITDVAGVDKYEEKRALCYRVNVEGTRNVASLARRYCKGFTYISSDYVFDGRKGNYEIDDVPNPVNFYAMTKLMGEEICKTVSNGQIIRTSFKPSEWKYPRAFVDQYTSADYVDVIAPIIWEVIKRGRHGVFHVGTGRKSVFDLAQQRNPHVGEISLDDKSVSVFLPRDVSLKGVKYGQ
jgi:dTDP-4-dehydrorhamnose reductase